MGLASVGFSFPTLKDVIHCLQTSIVSDEKSSFLLRNTSSDQPPFRFFPLSWTFSNFTVTGLGWVFFFGGGDFFFFFLHLPAWNSAEILWMLVDDFYQNWDIFTHNCFNFFFFCPKLILLSFWNKLALSYRLLKLCLYFKIFFPYILHIGYFLLICLRIYYLFFYSLHWKAHPVNILFQILDLSEVFL